MVGALWSHRPRCCARSLAGHRRALLASVLIALLVVTQLCTSGAALNASSRTTMCGPQLWNAKGIPRPIGADGTIVILTPAADHGHRRNTAAKAARQKAMARLPFVRANGSALVS